MSNSNVGRTTPRHVSGGAFFIITYFQNSNS